MQVDSVESVLTVPAIDHSKVGQDFRLRRNAAGKTIAEVAEKAGVSAPYISDLENGKRNWSPGIAQRLLEALK